MLQCRMGLLQDLFPGHCAILHTQALAHLAQRKGNTDPKGLSCTESVQQSLSESLYVFDLKMRCWWGLKCNGHSRPKLITSKNWDEIQAYPLTVLVRPTSVKKICVVGFGFAPERWRVRWGLRKFFLFESLAPSLQMCCNQTPSLLPPDTK